jgi:hypothetical protein
VLLTRKKVAKLLDKVAKKKRGSKDELTLCTTTQQVLESRRGTFKTT